MFGDEVWSRAAGLSKAILAWVVLKDLIKLEEKREMSLSS